MNKYKRPVGWKGESHRHYLAAKGIKTNKYFGRIRHRNRSNVRNSDPDVVIGLIQDFQPEIKRQRALEQVKGTGDKHKALAVMRFHGTGDDGRIAFIVDGDSKKDAEKNLNETLNASYPHHAKETGVKLGDVEPFPKSVADFLKESDAKLGTRKSTDIFVDAGVEAGRVKKGEPIMLLERKEVKKGSLPLNKRGVAIIDEPKEEDIDEFFAKKVGL